MRLDTVADFARFESDIIGRRALIIGLLEVFATERRIPAGSDWGGRPRAAAKSSATSSCKAASWTHGSSFETPALIIMITLAGHIKVM